MDYTPTLIAADYSGDHPVLTYTVDTKNEDHAHDIARDNDGVISRGSSIIFEGQKWTNYVVTFTTNSRVTV